MTKITQFKIRLYGRRKNEIEEILIVDVKVGTASLSTHQRRIRDTVKAGRVSFVTVRIGDDGKVTLKRETNINNNKKELDVAHHLEDNIIHEQVKSNS